MILFVPLMLQGAVMVVDEFYCHRRRGLPRWERIGHPLDTLSVVLCVGWLAWAEPGSSALRIYLALGAFSCLLVTKDEFVHQKECDGLEQWLHALLFVLHPLVLLALGWMWWNHEAPAILHAQLAVLMAFGAYQLIYWSPRRRPLAKPDGAGKASVNNEIYDQLQDRWYTASDDPIALLRAESRLRNPWVLDAIRALPPAATPPRILDMGCGAGFLSGYLGRAGLDVTGVDLSEESLKIARAHQPTTSDGTSRRVTYLPADVCKLPFASGTFDAVCAMDMLEHVENPAQAIAEAARVLKPGGLFFFHTFNRNPLSWLVVIKGVEWVVKNVPPDLHILRLFIKPAELRRFCHLAGLQTQEIRGVRPKVFSRAFLKLLSTGEVDSTFEFEFCRGLSTGYSGIARKLPS